MLVIGTSSLLILNCSPSFTTGEQLENINEDELLLSSFSSGSNITASYLKRRRIKPPAPAPGTVQFLVGFHAQLRVMNVCSQVRAEFYMALHKHNIMS